MAKKTTYLAALLQGKCPRCRQGDIFTYPAYALGKFYLMNRECQHCGIRLEPEPGFYQGAMYVGYGFTIACIAIISIPLYLIWSPDDWVYITAVISAMLLFVPLNYRYSRILYLYMFGGIKYNRDASQNKK